MITGTEHAWNIFDTNVALSVGTTERHLAEARMWITQQEKLHYLFLNRNAHIGYIHGQCANIIQVSEEVT